MSDEELARRLPCDACGADTGITGADLAPLPAGVLADVVVFCDACRPQVHPLPPSRQEATRGRR